MFLFVGLTCDVSVLKVMPGGELSFNIQRHSIQLCASYFEPKVRRRTTLHVHTFDPVMYLLGKVHRESINMDYMVGKKTESPELQQKKKKRHRQ